MSARRSDALPSESSVGTRGFEVERHEPGGEPRREQDLLAAEEPLEIRVAGRPLAVTLRTPGHDHELALGFLHSEGIVGSASEVVAFERPDSQDPQRDNRLIVELSGAALERWAERAVAREFRATSACGVCGKPSLEDLEQRLPELVEISWERELVHQLPARMLPRQHLFERTGGLHAAALFTPRGEVVALYEDVGRHNAVDKLIGARLLAGETSLAGRLLVVSGRAGFEIVQKAAVARCPVLVAVGAASSLAVELAAEVGMELWSFVHPQRANRHLAARTGVG